MPNGALVDTTSGTLSPSTVAAEAGISMSKTLSRLNAESGFDGS